VRLFSFSDKTLRRYLLGQLSRRRSDRLEKNYLSDDHLHQRLLLAEDDLIDAYLDGQLSTEQRALFKEHFLNTAERIERVALARDIRRISQGTPHTDETLLPRRLALRLALPIALTATAALIALGALFLWRRNPTTPDPAQTMVKPSNPGALSAISRPTVAFLLSPATRSMENAGNTVHLPTRPATVRLVFQANGSLMSRYRATIHPVAGTADLTVDVKVSIKESSLMLDLPSEALAPGDYEVFFEELASGGDWAKSGGAAFRVVRGEKN